MSKFFLVILDQHTRELINSLCCDVLMEEGLSSCKQGFWFGCGSPEIRQYQITLSEGSYESMKNLVEKLIKKLNENGIVSKVNDFCITVNEEELGDVGEFVEKFPFVLQ